MKTLGIDNSALLFGNFGKHLKSTVFLFLSIASSVHGQEITGKESTLYKADDDGDGILVFRGAEIEIPKLKDRTPRYLDIKNGKLRAEHEILDGDNQTKELELSEPIKKLLGTKDAKVETDIDSKIYLIVESKVLKPNQKYLKFKQRRRREESNPQISQMTQI